MPAWSRACFAAAAVVCAAVILGGFELGAAKGAVRVLPGPRYQVSVIGNSPTGWTTVSLGQFRYWQASFVREDGLFMFFGLGGLCKTRLLIHPRVPWPDSYESSRHASLIRSNGFSGR